MVDHYMLDKLLDKIKKIIGTEKFDNTEILIETDDKFPDDITLNNVVILTTSVIRENNKFRLQVVLQEALKYKKVDGRW